MRIGIDAMGGDHAPVVEVQGALAAREHLAPEDRIVLVGQEGPVRAELDRSPGWQDFIEVRHAEQVIGMDEPPVEAMRSKPNCSLAVLTKMHRDGELDAAVSAGNTGAFVAAATMHLRRLREVHRPGIAVVAPTYRGPVTICDVGANVSCRPQHLHQYGIMASLYLQALCKIEDPRVALLSIGEEDAKGNDLVRGAHELLRADKSLRFIGNVEGRDLFRGVTDLILCDGFVGNVVLKLVEGMAESVVMGLMRELTGSLKGAWGLLGAKIKKTAKDILHKYDFNEYGGAPLLGVNGICIICHGSSNYRAIVNAIRVSREFAKHNVNDRIVQHLAEQPAVS